MVLLLLQAAEEPTPEMSADLSSLAAVASIFVAVLTFASLLGGYFALKKQVKKIDDRLEKVTEALPDLARRRELERLSDNIQELRLANERLATRGQLEDLVKNTGEAVQSLRLTAQEFTGVLTIMTKTQAEVSELRRDVEILKSKTRGA